MIKTLHLSLFALASCLCMAAAAEAQELRGDALVQALNGKSFACKFNGGTLTWTFSRSDPNGKVFPYTILRDGHSSKNAYKLDKKGRAKNKQTNQGRKIIQNKDGSLTVSGNGIPKSICKAH